MIFIDELKIKKDEILNKSSVIEKLFYSYLTKDEIEIGQIKLSQFSNIEKIAYNEFYKKSLDFSKEIKAEQKSDSTFEFHYSKNLIEFSAMALADFKNEEAKLNDYFKSQCLKDAFIISYIFPVFDYTENSNIESVIDKLVKSVFIEKDFSVFPKQFINALTVADELSEIFIIEKCYEYILSIHPVKNSKIKFSFLLDVIAKLSNRNLKQIKLKLFLKVLFLSIIVMLIVGLIPLYWDELGLEPYVTAALIIWPILLTIFSIYLFLFKDESDKQTVIYRYLIKKQSLLNKKLKIDEEKLKEIELEMSTKQ